MHAILDLTRPDFKQRPRVMVQEVCAMNTAKTPWFEGGVGVAVAGTDSEEALWATHPDLFMKFGDKKGPYFAEATNADFTDRMGEDKCDGCLFWATDEHFLCLDTEQDQGNTRRTL